MTVRIALTSPRAGHILQRESFRTSRLLDFCTEPELVKQIGHPSDRWPLVVLKELTDNVRDEAEEAGTAPAIHGAIMAICGSNVRVIVAGCRGEKSEQRAPSASGGRCTREQTCERGGEEGS